MPPLSRAEERTTKARVRPKFQVTIPQEVRSVYPLAEGQYVNVAATPEGILISQVPEVDPRQSWFWSPRWAALERSADEDFRAGRVSRADTAETAIATLKKKSSRRGRR